MIWRWIHWGKVLLAARPACSPQTYTCILGGWKTLVQSGRRRVGRESKQHGTGTVQGKAKAHNLSILFFQVGGRSCWNCFLTIGHHHFYFAEDKTTTSLCIFPLFCPCLILMAGGLLVSSDSPSSTSGFPWFLSHWGSHANMCTWSREENNRTVSRTAAQDGHKQEVFSFPLACWMQLWESHALCQNRYPFGTAKPRRGYPVKVACLEQSKQIQCFWELPLRWSEHCSCGCWHTSSTNREKKCQDYFNKGFQWESKACWWFLSCVNAISYLRH